MPAHLPPLLHAGIGDQIVHRSFDFAPRLPGEDSLAMRKIHRFEIVHETVKKRAEPELRHGIEIVESLSTAYENVAELGAIVQRVCHIAPLHGQRVHRRVAAFLRLVSDLDSQINQRGNANDYRGQLANRRHDFLVHTICQGLSCKSSENLDIEEKKKKAAGSTSFVPCRSSFLLASPCRLHQFGFEIDLRAGESN